MLEAGEDGGLRIEGEVEVEVAAASDSTRLG